MFRPHRICRPTSSRPLRHRALRHRLSHPEPLTLPLRLYHPGSCTFSRLRRRRIPPAFSHHLRLLALCRLASCICRRRLLRRRPPCITATCVRLLAAPRPRTTRRRRPRTAACSLTTPATRLRAWLGSSPPRCAPQHRLRLEVKQTGRVPTRVVLRIPFSEPSVR